MDPLLTETFPYLDLDRLKTLFQDLKYPKDKIRQLVKKGQLIKIRRDLYLLSPVYGRPYSRETLANMIFGPSYVSLEYALAKYGLIPERVQTVTSICAKRNKQFSTPLGLFTYKHIRSTVYPIGVELGEEPGGTFHIASPEKALCDLTALQNFDSATDVAPWLLDSMRMEREELMELDPILFHKIAEAYGKRSVRWMVRTISQWRNEDAPDHPTTSG